MPASEQQTMDRVAYRRSDGCDVAALTKSTTDEGLGSAQVDTNQAIIEGSPQ